MVGLRRLVGCLGLAVLLSGHSALAGTILYDGTASQLPSAQPWLSYFSDGLFSGGSATQTVVAGTGVRLATDQAVSAGYSSHTIFGVPKNPAFPTLDAAAGFRIDFGLQVHSESHISSNRAGFSALVLASDGRGIELGFWADEIWAQSASPLFTHAESVAFDTTVGLVDYDLTIRGNSWRLQADDVTILTGPTRDYSAIGFAPYTLSSFLFLGDDTGSAGADVTLASVSHAAVPEPTSALFLLGIVVCGGGRRLWRRQGFSRSAGPCAGRSRAAGSCSERQRRWRL